VEACEAMLRDWLSRSVPEEVAADNDYLAQFDRRQITANLAKLLDMTLLIHQKNRENS